MLSNFTNMDEKKTLLSNFERGCISVFNALTQKQKTKKDWHFLFTAQEKETISNKNKRIQFSKAKETSDKQKTRGQVDHLAMKVLHHDTNQHLNFRPTDLSSRGDLFDAIESIRCDAIGSRSMIGLQKNLRNHFKENFLNRPLVQNHDNLNTEQKRLIAFELLLLEQLTDQPLDKKLKSFTHDFEDWFQNNFSDKASNLVTSLNDQKQFAKKTRFLLDQLFPSDDVTETENEKNEEQKETDHNAQQNNSVPTDKENNDEQSDNKKQDDPLHEKNRPMQTISLLGQNTGQTDSTGENTFEANAMMNQQRQEEEINDIFFDGYKIFTKEHDVIVHAKDICSPAERKKLREELDHSSKSFYHEIRFMARKIRQFLMAQQRNWWQYDLEEGVLDTSRLSRVVTNPSSPLSYKQEIQNDFLDTIVCMLVDNSGSMRGRPISMAACCADILSETLEQCSIKTEVLGYTTQAWKGGLSKQDWVQAGKIPEHPGRLNDLNHIIYKSADTPLRRCKENFGVMLKEGLLKENIDGEAIIWAYNRLKNRPEKRKIIMVISDGAPVDDSTNTHNNNSNYLEQHLRQVTSIIEQKKDVELTAIGIGYNVNKFYQSAIQIKSADDLGKTLANKIISLFAKKDSRRDQERLQKIKKQIDGFMA